MEVDDWNGYDINAGGVGCFVHIRLKKWCLCYNDRNHVVGNVVGRKRSRDNLFAPRHGSSRFVVATFAPFVSGVDARCHFHQQMGCGVSNSVSPASVRAFHCVVLRIRHSATRVVVHLRHALRFSRSGDNHSVSAVAHSCGSAVAHFDCRMQCSQFRTA
jgi:hypothetical protein